MGTPTFKLHTIIDGNTNKYQQKGSGKEKESGKKDSTINKSKS